MGPDHKAPAGPLPTRWLSIDPARIDRAAVEEAAAVLRAGGLVAFPTETVYGLGANALSADAVERIFAVKGRPPDNPLIVHVATPEAAAALAAEWSGVAQKAAALFWPGPLTLVVPLGAPLPAQVTAGLNTVGVRIPAHPVALAILEAAAVPVAAPSANRSGRPSPTRAEHVWDDLKGCIDLVVDGGPVGVGVESTVLDVSVSPPMVLRPGGTSLEDLQAALGDVVLDPALVPGAGDTGSYGDRPWKEVPRAPGMKYRHYAPSCPAVLVEGRPGARRRKLAELADFYRARGLRVGVMATDAGAAGLQEGGGLHVRTTGPGSDAAAYATRLFQYLRELESIGCDIVLMEGIEPHGIGLAVMDRLRKAAGFRVIRAEEEDSPSQPSGPDVGNR